MARAEASIPTKSRHLPRLGRLGWFFSAILVGAAAFFAAHVALIFGYREEIVFNGQAIVVPDRLASFWIGVAAMLPAILFSIMRRHDRDNSGWDVSAIALLTVASSMLDAFGLVLVPSVSLPLFAIVAVGNVYSLVVLLFLPGDKGANRYGSREGHPEIVATRTVPAAHSATPASPRNALEGSPKPGITLTEQANGQRIGRSMFIGHTAGYLLILATVVVALAFAGFGRPTSYDALFAFTTPPTVVHLPYVGLHPYAVIGLSVIALLVWTDLTVRRRHDRGRSGVDAMIFQILLLASVIIHTFGDAPDIVGWLDAFLVLYGVYLFLVLVILPGDPGENKYGAVPRPD